MSQLPGVYKWDDPTSSWIKQNAGIASGTSLPTNPMPADYFQITKAAAPTTAVFGGGQTLTGGPDTLFVNSTAGFNSSGAFKVDGIAGTCGYTGLTPASFTGVGGCTGFPDDKATITAVAANTTATGAQTLTALGSLNVANTTGFASTGSFTVGSATCTYTGTTLTSFSGLGGAGCTGSVADKAAVTSSTAAPSLASGVYQFDGGAWTFLGDGLSLPDIPVGTTLPSSPATGDFFNLTSGTPGIYRYDGTAWDLLGPDLYYRLAEHDILAAAESGASGDSSTLSLAGALAHRHRVRPH